MYEGVVKDLDGKVDVDDEEEQDNKEAEEEEEEEEARDGDSARTCVHISSSRLGYSELVYSSISSERSARSERECESSERVCARSDRERE